MVPNSPKEEEPHCRPVFLRCKRGRRDLPDISASEATGDTKGTPNVRDATAGEEQMISSLGLPAAELAPVFVPDAFLEEVGF